MLETTLFPVRLKLYGIKPVSFPGSIDFEMLGFSVSVSVAFTGSDPRVVWAVHT